jgi:3-methyladenine DNA glycosylase AlkD
MKAVKKALLRRADRKKAEVLQRFFRTGKGQYGEGDIFIGISVPEIRKIAKQHSDISMADAGQLLKSRIHEERLAALLILIEKYRKKPESRKEIFDFYLGNTKNINNWDLVDLSASYIAGDFLLDKDRAVLQRLAKSGHLWERRIAIVATYAFIRKNDFKDTLAIAKILLYDKHDLIHKATGWMLREVGKRDEKELEKFLNAHCKAMPRTTLRYAIERLPERKRRKYLAAQI